MSNILIKIDRENLNLAWNDAVHYIDRALSHTPEYKLMDVYHLLKTGAISLWMFYNEDKKKPFGAMATEIYEHPQMRTLNIFLMAADDFDEVEPLFPAFIDYARRIGADAIDCAGRFGLDKLLSRLGFKKSYIVMNYDVN